MQVASSTPAGTQPMSVSRRAALPKIVRRTGKSASSNCSTPRTDIES
jgi:hypothetical protein